MKTIQLEVHDAIYQKVIDFLSLLPPEQCHLIDSDEELENQELNQIADARLIDGQKLIQVSLADL